ncbi:hypothetical protein RT717_07350 [Imperialibacter roseus]|uniref:Uncharacterized protein n=1 Tax=Imperialibacter roseus TaxID=1324217 RepID=A0ABZ0IXT4_9BACT|nr:hypothetical protein [Imperialibacter roseus]WOK08452.1 hypothetical protein RT717_07350 [Imperialibacter roseus]
MIQQVLSPCKSSRLPRVPSLLLFLSFRRAFIFTISQLAIAVAAYSQEVVITQLALQPDGNVVLKYNLNDDRLDRKFSLYLYASTDNYIQPLTNVSGDVGVDLAVGGNKTIIWNAKEELGDTFAGDVSLELKGNIYVPFIALDNFDDYKVLKRGKPYEVTWTGGRGDNVLLFELYEEDSKIKVFEERPNVGNTTIIIPKDVKSGNYRFKISDSRNRDEVVFTKDFRVKAKVPMVVKAGLGLALLGGVGYIVSLGGAGAPEEKIGDPISPPSK